MKHHHHDPLADFTIDVYSVGIWHDLARLPAEARHLGARIAWARLRILAGRALTDIRTGNWRALRNSLNAYLAEPDPWPDGLKGCGYGLTRAGALRKLRRRMKTGR
ncbi:hypothetical protein NGM33_28530 [Nocardiopsis dassonvillei]|uniref:hypothetical protein n=1 Tax=Nocardiopsis dassonvillei TaxID=2014 RepID=UPI0020A4329F|nr:hypothetical protein [Nocardiopsis dassonvillei]MCP3017283.1 hypothetical protein [Nocardiopsis dassonvillei]